MRENEAYESSKRKLEILEKFKHPNIIQILAFGR
jgi:hypothetical protein